MMATSVQVCQQMPQRYPWPHKLEEKQGLELRRAEVLKLQSSLYAVVAYDGRNECYLCWPTDSGGFRTDRLVSIPRQQAHAAPRHRNSLHRIPPMPPVDHTGRPLREAGLPRQQPISLQIAARERLHSCEDAGGAGGSTPSCPVPRAAPPPRRLAIASLAGPADEVLEGQELPPVPAAARHRGDHVLPESRPKACTVCAVLKVFARMISIGLAHMADTFDQLSEESLPGPEGDEGYVPARHDWEQQPIDEIEAQLHRASTLLQRRRTADLHTGLLAPGLVGGGASCSSAPAALAARARGGDSDALGEACDGVRLRRSASAMLAQGAERALSENVQRNTFTDLRIEIPIVRPPGWSKVMPLVEEQAVTFDERGVKETMTVKSARWSDFVDRQKNKLEAEIAEVRKLAAKRAEECSLSDWDREGAGSCAAATDWEEDDIEELVKLVGRIDDWKDLCRYSGKSISMASTKYGNEMKIHVMAFAERDDGTGVDFMRVSYKKSVEVQRFPTYEHSSWSGTLRMVLPFLRPLPHTDVDKAKEHWVQLLQRPDMAKFTIALAFRAALESDGVLLKFCKARFDDVADL